MEQKKKKCTYCGKLKCYYTKGLYHFDRTKEGYCSFYKKTVCSTEACEYWESNSRTYFWRKQVATRALYEIFMDISAIRQILQEGQEEGKNL